MGARIAALVVVVGLLATVPRTGSAECKIGKIAELPVTMSGLRPMVTAQINGVDAQFIADSGAFYSTISPASAAERNLRVTPSNIRVRGITGSTDAGVTTVKEFTLAGVPIRNVQFIVGGSQPGRAVGLLGQNVLHLADVEYDLAHGAIRLLKPQGCEKSDLAYWAQNGERYSVIEIAWATQASPHTTGTALVNGAKVRVVFDTGAAFSLLSLRAAERAGVTPDSAGVVKAGLIGGLGTRSEQTWLAPIDSFDIGGEEIKHTNLRFGDVNLPEGDMMRIDKWSTIGRSPKVLVTSLNSATSRPELWPASIARLMLPSRSRRSARSTRSCSSRLTRPSLRVRRASTPLRIQTSSCAQNLSNRRFVTSSAASSSFLRAS